MRRHIGIENIHVPDAQYWLFLLGVLTLLVEMSLVEAGNSSAFSPYSDV